MKVKKIAVIGILAVVVIGCVIAAGCTSTTTLNTTTISVEPVVGTWTLADGTTVIFTDDFKGIMTSGDKAFNFTWKKINDEKYQVDREDGAQVIWTFDNVKGTMTNPKGDILAKQSSDTSGGIITDFASQMAHEAR